MNDGRGQGFFPRTNRPIAQHGELIELISREWALHLRYPAAPVDKGLKRTTTARAL